MFGPFDWYAVIEIGIAGHSLKLGRPPFSSLALHMDEKVQHIGGELLWVLEE